jgi:glutathione peroxidase
MSIYDIKVKTISGEETTLSPYKGKLMLIVNVASKCGFTPQYKGLQELYQAFQNELVVLGFPCNQFGHQEPGSSQEIKQFCDLSYQVTFPMFEKIEVNGADTHPLYQHLKQERPGLLGTEAIKWNFTKFLVDRQGQVVKRYAPNDTPASIRKDLEAYL